MKSFSLPGDLIGLSLSERLLLHGEQGGVTCMEA